MKYKIVSKYIKDLSFEISGAKAYFLLEKNIKDFLVNFDIKSQKINQNVINLHKSLDKYFAEKISLIFYLDADIDTCLSRINKRESSDKFESKGKKFLEKIQKSYSEVFKDNKKVIKVETNQDKDIVNKTIIKNIDKLFNDKQ